MKVLDFSVNLYTYLKPSFLLFIFLSFFLGIPKKKKKKHFKHMNCLHIPVSEYHS